jgi:hypothetical protein
MIALKVAPGLGRVDFEKASGVGIFHIMEYLLRNCLK